MLPIRPAGAIRNALHVPQVFEAAQLFCGRGESIDQKGRGLTDGLNLKCK